MQATRFYTILLLAYFCSATASAQVFDSGPSDPAPFTNVINLPGDMVSFPDSSDVGGVIGETTQVNVDSGGTVGFNSNARSGSEFNISGGSVGNVFDAFGGSEFNISGGSVGNFFNAFGGSEINISGGSVGFSFDAFDDSEVNISGGTVDGFFDARGGSVVNISGGSAGDVFDAFLGSEVNLFGSDFILDGVLLDDLVFGEAFTILDRDVTLSGLLADGSAFSFDLNSGPVFGQNVDIFSTGATLTVTSTSVPEPSSVVILLLGCGLAGMRRVRSAA